MKRIKYFVKKKINKNPTNPTTQTIVNCLFCTRAIIRAHTHKQINTHTHTSINTQSLSIGLIVIRSFLTTARLWHRV